jgi:periplasmic divalent cation tolerance protein
MDHDLITLLCTCPDSACGEHIAADLLDKRLAACVNLVAGVRSFYRWEDAVQSDPEILLIIKSTAARFNAIESAVMALHPYDVPELIALDITAGSAAYLDWLKSESR